MTIGFFHVVTRRGMFLQMIASRNTVPPRMFLCEQKISFELKTKRRRMLKGNVYTCARAGAVMLLERRGCVLMKRLTKVTMRLQEKQF